MASLRCHPQMYYLIRFNHLCYHPPLQQMEQQRSPPPPHQSLNCHRFAQIICKESVLKWVGVSALFTSPTSTRGTCLLTLLPNFYFLEKVNLSTIVSFRHSWHESFSLIATVCTIILNDYVLSLTNSCFSLFTGLSKQQIGEYLGNLQNPFNQLVLEYFARQIDLSGLPVDIALRKFQTYFRFPGESQKIERLVQIFAARYVECNPCVENIPLSSSSPVASQTSSQFHDDSSSSNNGDSSSAALQADIKYNPPAIINPSELGSTAALSSGAPLEDPCHSLPRMTKDDVFTLSFAIIMLNTDLHSPNVKNRMTPQQFVKNLRHVLPDHVHDSILGEIYSRVKSSELKTGNDHGKSYSSRHPNFLHILKILYLLLTSSDPSAEGTAGASSGNE